MLTARKLAAIAELLGRRIEEEMALDLDARSMITGFARTTAEVSAAMNMTPAAARTIVMAAETLDRRLPAIAALLAAGHLDWYHVQIIIARTELVDDDKCALLDAALAQQVSDWKCWSRQAIINAVDTAVTTIDAEAAKQRREVAYDDRGVDVRAGLDGMAQIRARLSASAGAVFDRRLSELAKAVCPGDPRTLKQRRADALNALLNEQALACQCDNPDCPHRPTPTPPATSAPTTVINVITSAATLSGTSQAPGYLLGYGVIDAAMVRELARDATRRILQQPQIGDDQALTYRPSAALARWIRCRDMTCRFPGCTVPADRCDIDHTEPFNHADPTAGGQTVPDNLACYCRQHHRLKTFHSGPHGWQDKQLPDATIVWTSPTGQVYRTTPGGTDLFPELRNTRSRRPEDHQRITAARTRLAQQRPTNDYHRHRNRAATQEIHARQFRNRFRRTRVLFHGYPTTDKPSTSPFCRWVNNPIEPEQLPPNWQPPPQTPTNPNQPPPF